VIKDVYSIELDNKKSKEELAIAYVKQTATSAVETKYFRDMGSEMVVEEPRGYSGTGSGSGDGPGRGNTTRKKPKGSSYYKYALIENKIEVEVSNNVTKSKKTVKFPVKADKIEVFKTMVFLQMINRMLILYKPISIMLFTKRRINLV